LWRSPERPSEEEEMRNGVASVVSSFAVLLAGPPGAWGCSNCDKDECDKQAAQIRVRADGDTELNAYQKEHPCVDPPLKTTTTDYGPACAKLKECLDKCD
jgi:hypothetical protein